MPAQLLPHHRRVSRAPRRHADFEQALALILPRLRRGATAVVTEAVSGAVTVAPPFAHSDAGTPETVWAAELAGRSLDAFELDPGVVRRLVVVAAHPDDETLGAGGLLRKAHDLGLDVAVVMLTAGEGSHPRSPTHDPGQLAARRLDEGRAAVELLAPGARVTHLGLPDGGVADHEGDVVAAIVDLVGEAGPATLIAAPWRHDGHTDHEAAGRAASLAAARTDARLAEYPVWLWHWGDAEGVPWSMVRRLLLDANTLRDKEIAISLHATQVKPLSSAAGDEALLHAGLLGHFRRPFELFVVGAVVDDDTFDRVHAETEDPWQVRSSWFEERKRSLTLAVLPRRHYARVLEVGSSLGELAADLAARCDDLVAVDRSQVAVDRARDRLRGERHTEVVRLTVPDEWPRGSFDLVVVSEVGYFLSPGEVDRLGRRIRECLRAEGDVVLCHWRHPITGWPLDGDRVHERLRAVLIGNPLGEKVRHLERDFRLEVLSAAEDESDAARRGPVEAR